MIRTIASVVRGEGLASAVRRAHERIGDAVRDAALRAGGAMAAPQRADVLNVIPAGSAARLGGVQTQLMWRLQCERMLRPVALLRSGMLECSGRARRAASIDEALALTRARILHVEGTSGADVGALLALAATGLDLVIGVHDFTLFDAPLAQRLLDCVRRAVFPSQFLLDAYGARYALHDVEIIEPGVPPTPLRTRGRAIAYAGAVKPHKGARLLPHLADGIDIHVFGGGDEALFRELRRQPNLKLHGYYSAGRLPRLLARHRIGLVVVPSVVPESFCLVLSEAWQTGAAVAVLDHGAQSERVRRHGGGWIARDTDELAGIVRNWHAGTLETSIPTDVASAADAAAAYATLYREIAGGGR